MPNVYFELTRELKGEGVIAVLGSGQAVVHYRIAMMSKDGDWILRESPAACARVLDVLEGYGARYRPGAPLDVRWLAGGWSSHFEFLDGTRRRVRCDFFSRPPRVPLLAIEALFAPGGKGELRVVGLQSLIRMKQTQRAKDYPVIGELARLLPPEEAIEHTTDPDRILDLAAAHGAGSLRPPVLAALNTIGPPDTTSAPSASADWETCRSERLTPPWCRWRRSCSLSSRTRSRVKRP